MVAWNYGPTWAERTSRYGRDAIKPVRAKVIDNTRPKAIRIDTGLKKEWLPRRLVMTDPENGVVYIPMWLCQKKLLD